MGKVKAFPAPVSLKHRTQAVSMWLAQSLARSFTGIRLLIGGNSVTVHSTGNAEVVLRCEWDDQSIVVEAGEPVRSFVFTDIQVSLRFIDAVLCRFENSSEPPLVVPSSLVDDVFWSAPLTQESDGEQTSERAKAASTAKSTAVPSVPMHTAAMESWVGAWAL